MLRYVPVTLEANGHKVNTVALLDEGSSITLMEDELCHELQLIGAKEPLCLNLNEVSLNVSAIGNNKRSYRMQLVRTVKKLDLPEQSINCNQFTAKYTHLKSLPLSSFNPSAPKLIIRMDHYFLTRPLKTIERSMEEPVATKTRLGWVVSGKCDVHDDNRITSSVSVHQVVSCECQDIDKRIDAAMRGCFALDDVVNSKEGKFRSKCDERALEILNSITTLEGNRYTSGLLWRGDEIKLPNNYSMALKRLNCLERRMNREKHLWDNMNTKLREYVEKCYIKRLSQREKETYHPRKWYLPIFPVFKPNKLSIVWDAAAKFKGVSLNLALLTDLLPPLPNNLFRFREYKIAIAANISEMYHQVCINSTDQQSQRFLWRWSPDQEPQEYIMRRMTLDRCAQYVKNTKAERFSDQFPLAVKCIKEDHYVDDFLTSVETDSCTTH